MILILFSGFVLCRYLRYAFFQIHPSFHLFRKKIIKLFLLAGMIVYDVLGILSGGLEVLSFGIVLQYLVTALVSFGASMAGIRLLRRFAADHGFGLFGVYCWGLALFIFILNLVV